MIIGDEDRKCWQLNQLIIGVDECGRGPIAGDCYIGLVCFFKPNIDYISSLGLNDSKKISNKKRFDLENKIKDTLTGYFFFIRKI